MRQFQKIVRLMLAVVCASMVVPSFAQAPKSPEVDRSNTACRATSPCADRGSVACHGLDGHCAAGPGWVRCNGRMTSCTPRAEDVETCEASVLCTDGSTLACSSLASSSCVARSACFARCGTGTVWCDGATRESCSDPRPPAEMWRGPSPTAEVTVLGKATRP